jgi:uncharacterized protein
MPPSNRPKPQRSALPEPLGEEQLQELQHLLDQIPAPLEPLDASMLDGYLCGVLLQPKPIAPLQWMPYVTDVDGRALPAKFQTERLSSLVRRRHAELNHAISEREWFDPWIFELREESPATHDPAYANPVYPWVAGFATAMQWFPALMDMDESETTAPLALLYRHFDPQDLEDAEALLAEIDSLEPPEDLSDAVEGLVRATLLLADVSRPLLEDQPAVRKKSVKRSR